jgi:hypothetical protein
MTDQTNSEYFATRAATEHSRSCAASDPRAAAAHAEMARRYVELAAEFLEREANEGQSLPPVFHPPVETLFPPLRRFAKIP